MQVFGNQTVKDTAELVKQMAEVSLAFSRETFLKPLKHTCLQW